MCVSIGALRPAVAGYSSESEQTSSSVPSTSSGPTLHTRNLLPLSRSNLSGSPQRSYRSVSLMTFLSTSSSSEVGRALNGAAARQSLVPGT